VLQLAALRSQAAFAVNHIGIGMAFAFAQFFLFFFGQLHHLVALFAATVSKMIFAGIALNKKQIAIDVCAIGMLVAGIAALVAIADNIVGNAFAQTIVEHKVFSLEFRLQSFGFNFLGVGYDATMQLVYIVKAVMP
jgi:hypothetical protein